MLNECPAYRGFAGVFQEQKAITGPTRISTRLKDCDRRGSCLLQQADNVMNIADSWHSLIQFPCAITFFLSVPTESPVPDGLVRVNGNRVLSVASPKKSGNGGESIARLKGKKR